MLKPPLQPFERFEEVQWAEDSQRGLDLVFVREEPWPVLKLLRLSWPSILNLGGMVLPGDDGWRRAAWTVIERIPPLRRLLVLVVAPEVAVQLLMLPEALAASPVAIDMAIIRAPAADLIPQDGEPIRLGAILGSDVTVAAAMQATDPSTAPGFMARGSQPAPYPGSETARFRWLPDGVVAVHPEGHWEVRVKLDVNRPGAFALDLVPDPAAVAMLARSAFLATVVTWGDGVEVTCSQRSTMFPIPVDPVSPIIERPALAELSQVSVRWSADVPGIPPPPAGIDITKARSFAEVKSSYDYPTWQTTFVNTLIFAYEVNPIIGPLFEISHLAYAATKGQTLAGQEVTEGDLLLMGTFAAISVVGGVGALKGYQEVGLSLFALGAGSSL